MRDSGSLYYCLADQYSNHFLIFGFLSLYTYHVLTLSPQITLILRAQKGSAVQQCTFQNSAFKEIIVQLYYSIYKKNSASGQGPMARDFIGINFQMDVIMEI